MNKEITRNPSIDILKFIAVLLITHSHMELLYGKYGAICTGGSIGDSLFFFISGFTLFLGRDARFDNWYKRRINRIYPTVFAWALMSCVVFHSQSNFLETILYGGGRFVTCIMIAYIPLFFIKKYLINNLNAVMMLMLAVVFVVFFRFCDNKSGMYASDNMMWPLYCFSMMLFGAIIGLKSQQHPIDTSNYKLLREFAKMICCLVLFYAIFIYSLKPGFCQISIIALLPLYGVIYYLYRICNSPSIIAIYHKPFVRNLFFWGGSLCLEVYLVQPNLYTDRFNYLFPLNVLGTWIVIFAVAYTLKFFSNFFSQTFKDMDYDWKKMITIK